MAGAFGETVNNELAKLEERKKNLSDAVATEEIKQRVTKDKLEIQGYLEKFKNADMKNPENRELVLNYFVDKIYLYDDRIVITGKYDDDGFGGSAEYMLSEKRDGKSKRVRPLSTVPHNLYFSGSPGLGDPLKFPYPGKCPVSVKRSMDTAVMRLRSLRRSKDTAAMRLR